MANNREIASVLGTLKYVEAETASLYKGILGAHESELAQTLKGFQKDHEDHVSAITGLCETLDIEPEQPTGDVPEMADEYRRMVDGSGSLNTALQGLLLAEQFNSVLYDAAEHTDLPAEFGDIVTEHHADDRLHVAYLRERVGIEDVGDSISREHAISCLTGGYTDDISPDDFE
ncbi:MAG: hypothetical protein HY876_02715 [Coriobacteriales bacterium]|nr:hypothetical protein [Coriobacteriales bacterium]